jgi:hypothetical protein
MQMHETQRVADLEVLLDRLHAALRDGDLAGLPLLAQDLEAAALDGVAAGDAARIRQKARHTAALLDATGRGLRSALRRLRDIASAAAGGQVYDGRGKARRIAPGPERLATRF